MGKGDKRSLKGKRSMGSHGNSRPSKKKLNAGKKLKVKS